MSFPEPHEIYKRRYGRNIGLGAVLLAFVVLMFGRTVVKVTNEGAALDAAKAAAGDAGVTTPAITGY